MVLTDSGHAKAWLKPGYVCTVMVRIHTPDHLPQALERTMGRRDTHHKNGIINEAMLHLGLEFHSDLPHVKEAVISKLSYSFIWFYCQVIT